MKGSIATAVLGAFVATAVATPGAGGYNKTRRNEAACQAAVAALGADKVDTRPLNEDIVTINWSQTCISEPYCIIQPTSAADVSKALKVICTHQAKFAVRSGGHSPNPGWSSISGDGILIDMSVLSDVTVSADASVVSVGPGAYWGDVSAATAASGVTAIGARAPYVGVGGLLLGGGYSYFASEYGLSVDQVKNYEIVLANGTITNANANQNSDLWWALKGGGPNFGIVTRIDLHTVPINEMWYHGLAFSSEQAYEVFDALAEWQNNGASDSKSNMLFSAGLDSILVLLSYSEPAVQPEAFAPFYALTPAGEVVPATNSTLAVLHQLVEAAFPVLPARHDYRGISSDIDAPLYKEMYDFWYERAAAVHESTGTNQTFVIQHISANVAQIGNANGGNPLNLPQKNHQWWTTLIDWENEADDAVARSASIELTEQWKTVSKERGLDIDYIYMNDASRDQNPLASYGTTNVEKLKKISLKYDPHREFQKLQNNGFLLSKL